MKKFMDWLSNSFAPAMNRVTRYPWVAALSSTMQKIIPFILTGSAIFLYNVFRSYITTLPDLGKIADYTFGMLGLLTAFMMGNQVMEKLGKMEYSINAGLTSITVFMMFIKPTVNPEGIMAVAFNRFGPTAIIVGIFSGLFVALVFDLISRLKILKDSDLPDFIVSWINNILFIFTSVGIAALLTFKFNLDMFSAILSIFEPIKGYAESLPGLVLISLIVAFFYSLGISTWLWGAILTPIFMAGITENITNVANGLPATNIVTSETFYTAALITMGGVGATLTLNILMLFSKSKELQTIAKMSILPSIFNINEPIMFSAPIVMNPLLMVPMWLNSISGALIVWGAMKLNFLNIPDKMIQVGQIPAPISSVMITQDLRALVVYIILFAVYGVTWYPFFKVYEKERLTTESDE